MTTPTRAIGATRTLGAFAANLEKRDVPSEVTEKVRGLLLDFVGATLGGAALPEVAALSDVVLAQGSIPVASVLGRNRGTSVADAAFCNGMAGDVLEHQDGYRFGGFHPSHALPTLLAVAEQRDRTIGDIVMAAVVAYEIANRIGRAVHPRATVQGWFPTAAAYGAAAGAGRLLGLDADRIAHAMGATAFFAPAVLIESIFGGWTSKPGFAGQLARAGAQGALAADAGLTGWPSVLEDPRGLVAMLGGDPGTAVLSSGLGSEWTVLDVHQKRFAGCRHTHGAAQAVLHLVRERDIAAHEIADVDVEAYSVAHVLVDRPVTTGDSAVPCTLSLPYVTAAAVVHGEVTGRQYDRSSIDDPVVQALAQRVRLRTAQDLEAQYPDFTATRVTLTTTDGRCYTHTVDLPAGDARVPLEMDELLEKFHRYVSPAVGDANSARAADLMLDSAGAAEIRALTALLCEGHELAGGSHE